MSPGPAERGRHSRPSQRGSNLRGSGARPSIRTPGSRASCGVPDDRLDFCIFHRQPGSPVYYRCGREPAIPHDRGIVLHPGWWQGPFVPCSAHRLDYSSSFDRAWVTHDPAQQPDLPHMVAFVKLQERDRLSAPWPRRFTLSEPNPLKPTDRPALREREGIL